jgi:VIT1/CCC1 family predicted Fe2+/Mn2+ transporter
MSQVTFCTRSTPKEPSFSSPQGKLQNRVVEDFTPKCEIARKIKNQGHADCLKAIAYAIGAAIVIAAIVFVAMQAALLAISLLSLVPGSALAIGVGVVVGLAIGYPAARWLAAPLVLKAIDHLRFADNSYQLSGY